MPNWLSRRTEVSSTDKLVYAKLCQYAGKDGKCYPSQERLSEDLGFSARHVRNSIGNLIRLKLIVVVRNNFNYNNAYRFLKHEWQDPTGTILPLREERSFPFDRNNTSSSIGTILPVREERSFLSERNNTSSPYNKRIVKENNKENNIREGEKAALEKKGSACKN